MGALTAAARQAGRGEVRLPHPIHAAHVLPSRRLLVMPAQDHNKKARTQSSEVTVLDNSQDDFDNDER